MTANDNPYAQWERNFREQMVRLREAQGLRQVDLAKTLKGWGLPFHQQTVQRIENGDRPVRLNEAHLIAQALGVDLDSMTSQSTPTARELGYAVDRFRRESLSAFESVMEAHADWTERYEDLAYEFLQQKEVSPDRPSDETVWAGAWIAKGLRVHNAMWDAMVGLWGIGFQESAEDWEERFPYQASDMFGDVTERILDGDYWKSIPYDLRPETLALKAPEALAKMRPKGDDDDK